MFSYQLVKTRLAAGFSHLVVASACVALLVSPSVPTARADETPAIGWTQLGLSSRVELQGSNEPTGVAVPVPEGVAPAVLSGTIGPVVKATGRVDVLDGRGVVLGNIPVPVDVAAVPFVVDVSAAEGSPDGRS